MPFCPICGDIVKQGNRCPRCRPERSRHQRGYDSKHVALRHRMINENPLCRDCEEKGRVTPAEEMHHIIKIIEAPHLRLDPSNVVMLCKKCHDARHDGEKDAKW